MTPEPMSDEQIRQLSDAADIAWGKACGGPMPYELFAASLIAARDAQWREMLGEPVAWIVAGGKAFSNRAMLSKVAADAAVAHRRDGSAVSPLYAIKVKP